MNLSTKDIGLKKCELDNVYKFWFDPQNDRLHFNSTPQDDQLIRQKFEHLLEADDNEWKNDDDNLVRLLCYIILYDQMVRHFYRDNANRVAHYHSIALEISQLILDKGLDFKLNPAERCFLLLPLRHTFDENYLEICISKIKAYKEELCGASLPSIYKRFWRATILSYSNIVTNKIDIESINEQITNEQIFAILDTNNLEGSNNLDKSRVNRVENLSVYCDLSSKNNFYRHCSQTLKNLDKYEGITVSVSGGVDSMVCCFVLSHVLQRKGKELCAVMINYGNRDTCDIEVELVKRWCKLLNIKLYVRHIKHLKRFEQSRNDDRNLYEQITREMRFQMYQKLGYPVVLGHNYSDCEENILTNVLKKKHYDNLRGMRKIGEEKNVIILRPLLDVPKYMIYEFALQYQVPHVYDSTPDWSMRGQIRNELIPVFDSIDGGFMPSLTHLADVMASMYNDIESSVKLMFELFCSDEGGVFSINIGSYPDYYDRGFAFWQKVIIDISRKKNLKQPSAKSIKYFCEHLSDKKPNQPNPTNQPNNKYKCGLIRMNDEFSFKTSEKGLELIIN